MEKAEILVYLKIKELNFFLIFRIFKNGERL